MSDTDKKLNNNSRLDLKAIHDAHQIVDNFGAGLLDSSLGADNLIRYVVRPEHIAHETLVTDKLRDMFFFHDELSFFKNGPAYSARGLMVSYFVMRHNRINKRVVGKTAISISAAQRNKAENEFPFGTNDEPPLIKPQVSSFHCFDEFGIDPRPKFFTEDWSPENIARRCALAIDELKALRAAGEVLSADVETVLKVCGEDATKLKDAFTTTVDGKKVCNAKALGLAQKTLLVATNLERIQLSMYLHDVSPKQRNAALQGQWNTTRSTLIERLNTIAEAAGVQNDNHALFCMVGYPQHTRVQNISNKEQYTHGLVSVQMPIAEHGGLVLPYGFALGCMSLPQPARLEQEFEFTKGLTTDKVWGGMGLQIPNRVKEVPVEFSQRMNAALNGLVPSDYGNHVVKGKAEDKKHKETLPAPKNQPKGGTHLPIWKEQNWVGKVAIAWYCYNILHNRGLLETPALNSMKGIYVDVTENATTGSDVYIRDILNKYKDTILERIETVWGMADIDEIAKRIPERVKAAQDKHAAAVEANDRHERELSDGIVPEPEVETVEHEQLEKALPSVASWYVKAFDVCKDSKRDDAQEFWSAISDLYNKMVTTGIYHSSFEALVEEYDYITDQIDAKLQSEGVEAKYALCNARAAEIHASLQASIPSMTVEEVIASSPTVDQVVTTWFVKAYDMCRKSTNPAPVAFWNAMLKLYTDMTGAGVSDEAIQQQMIEHAAVMDALGDLLRANPEYDKYSLDVCVERAREIYNSVTTPVVTPAPSEELPSSTTIEAVAVEEESAPTTTRRRIAPRFASGDTQDLNQVNYRPELIAQAYFIHIQLPY